VFTRRAKFVQKCMKLRSPENKPENKISPQVGKHVTNFEVFNWKNFKN
jgi:hypothetical protein